jgi:hypothetical protein
MPITEDNVGYSIYTQSKVYNFKKIVEMHTRICKGIVNRYKRYDYRYFYMDLTAGTGFIPSTDLPNCANVMIQTLQSNRVLFQAHLIDQENADILRCNLGPSPALYYYKQDHNNIAKDVIDRHVQKQPYGLIFYDPNGPGIVNGQWRSLDTISELYNTCPHLDTVDFMMYLSGTAVKRVKHITNRNLTDWLSTLGKEFWVVRKPKGPWQWTFLLGTNWDTYPKIKSIDFYPSNTSQGNIYFEDVCRTKKELYKLRDQHLSFLDLIGQEN